MTDTEASFAVGDAFTYIPFGNPFTSEPPEVWSVVVTRVEPMRFTPDRWWVHVKRQSNGREYDGSERHWLGGASNIVRAG